VAISETTEMLNDGLAALIHEFVLHAHDPWVEGGFHGEARSDRAQPTQSASTRFFGALLHDADERDR
jgi:hypothetical protein